MSTEAGRQMAQRVLDYIHEHPEQHDQNFYMGPERSIYAPVTKPECGTNMCIAGTAVYLAAFDRKVSVDAVLRPYANLIGRYDGAAADLLGISKEEADILFHQYDNEASVQLLKKVVVGESLTDEL